MNVLSFFKKSILLLCVGLAVTACSSDNNDEPENGRLDADKTAILKQYVNSVLVPTYKSLADAAVELNDLCATLKANPTQENVQKCCDKWIETRKYWERSEAFLFGAVEDYYIDPHIDSWPLQKTQLDNVLANADLMSQLSADGASAQGFANLGYGLLGFHAIEYVLFRNGAARSVSDISSNELIYNSAVAQDLMWQCIRLEASWTGIDNMSAAKSKLLQDNGLEPSMNYGETFLNAGQSGNTLYKTQLAAMEQILQGASDIADEVGNTKITDPVNSGNVLDVESWYSWNSIADFTDNLRSVRNAYYGSLDSTVNANSMAAWMQKNYPANDTAVRSAIVDAINTVAKMPAPFRNHLTKAETADAVAACNKLMSALDNAITAMNK